MELSTVLDPTRPPKSDKATLLSDAARIVVQLRNEAQEMKESNEKLEEAIKDLKVITTQDGTSTVPFVVSRIDRSFFSVNTGTNQSILTE